MENIKIKTININGIEYKENAKKYFKIEEIAKQNYETYDIRLTFSFLINSEIKESKVKLQYNYDIPLSDVTHIYRITKPCKRMVHEFFMQSNNWKIEGNAFTAFYYNNNENADAKFKVEQTVDNMVKVNFSEWTLPGTGYVIFAKPKDRDN